MDFKQLLLRRYRQEAGMSRYMVGRLTEDLSEDELNWQPGPGHHSIWHNLWHMFLSNDYYSANALRTRTIWEEQRWPERIDLTNMKRVFDFEGNAAEGPVPRFVIADVPDDLVDELKAVPLGQYLAYVDDYLARSTERLATLPEEVLLEHVEQYGRRPRAFDIATDFNHVCRHIGMMEDLRGLIRGPGTGTASL